ncbi:MAG: 16S rRNA (cytidine(1402)-2'-O)-methyltransferase [Bacillota bacterium]|nr:16S rRNA (cytidine(1402)-2'-O)-methyltransferase [Bacillota bacterium]
MTGRGILYVLATPIGHLGDLSQRALETLREADAMYAEDTRHTGLLLRHYGISLPLLSCHQHNELRRIPEILARLERGEHVVLASDAGTPGVSDPGLRVVEAVLKAGGRVSPLPGPSAVTAALSVAGFPASPFAFGGFLPRKKGPRRRALEGWREVGVTLVLYEAAPRLVNLLEAATEVYGPHHEAAVARELTKMFEDVRRGSLQELQDHYREEEPRGECTIVLGPVPKETGPNRKRFSEGAGGETGQTG